MSTGVELAIGWLRLVPSVEGIQDTIAKEFGAAGDAADKEGDKAGGRFGGSMKKAIGAAAIAAGVVAAFKGLYEVGNTFDNVTDTIRVGTGAQGEALDQLVDVAKNVGKTIPVEFEKAGSTVADLNTRLGLSGSTLQTVASQYLEAGRILGQHVDINATSAAFSSFKIEGDAVVGAMDTLFQVSQATGVGMNELASGIQANAPAVQALGFSFEDTAALVGSLDKAGLNSTQVMSSMSRSLVNLAKDGEAPQAAFERVIGELEGFIATGDQAAAIDLAGKVFGTRGAAQFIGALESGTLNMGDLMGATGATGDTILGLGEETMDFAEKWQITMNTATAAIEPLATAIFTGLSEGMTAVMPTLLEFGDWLGENTHVIGIAAGLIGGLLVAAFVAWTAKVIALNVALFMSPITWIIIGIVALIAAVVALVMNWDAVVAWITDIWSGFISWITSVVDGLVSWWNGVWQGFLGFITGIWNGIVAGVTDYINRMLAVIRLVLAVAQSVWNSMWSSIGSFFSGIWNGIISAVRTVQGVFSSVFGAIAGIVRGAFEGVVGVVKGVINGILRAVNGVINGINGVAGTVGSAFGLDVRIPNIPMLAEGGTIKRSGSVIVGERGPELLHLPAGAVVDPDISGAGSMEGMSISGRLEIGGDGLARIIDGRIVEADRGNQRQLRAGRQVR